MISDLWRWFEPKKKFPIRTGLTVGAAPGPVHAAARAKFRTEGVRYRENFPGTPETTFFRGSNAPIGKVLRSKLAVGARIRRRLLPKTKRVSSRTLTFCANMKLGRHSHRGNRLVSSRLLPWGLASVGDDDRCVNFTSPGTERVTRRGGADRSRSGDGPGVGNFFSRNRPNRIIG